MNTPSDIATPTAPRRRCRPSPRSVALVASGALAGAVLAGAPATAGTLISGWSLKNRTVSHTKLVKNTVTGVEVKESALAKVPVADRLDGLDSTDFVQGRHQRLVSFRRFAAQGADPETVEVPGVAGFRLTCTDQGELDVRVVATEAGATPYLFNRAGESSFGGVMSKGTQLVLMTTSSLPNHDSPGMAHVTLPGRPGTAWADLWVGGMSKLAGAAACVATIHGVMDDPA